jgi:hypothetical protein
VTETTSLPIEDEEASFAGTADKILRVQVLLDSDEFLFMRDLALSRGISQSALFRQLLIEERKRGAQEALSLQLRASNTHTSTQNLRSEDLNAIADLVAQKLKAA